MKLKVKFAHNHTWAGSYEDQARRAGYTLGGKAKELQKLGDAMILLWVQGILTESMYDKAAHVMDIRLNKFLKEL